jgi:polysaccharide export outer membrane protein
VTVSVAEYGSQKVFVAGEVQRPGQYALKADRSLLALLGDIGPVGPNAGHEVIVVRPPPPAARAGRPSATPAVPHPTTPCSSGRGPGGRRPAGRGEHAGEGPPGSRPPPPPRSRATVRGARRSSGQPPRLQSNPEKNIALRAGDTVFFPRASQVYVMGSVGRPGPYRFQEGMTVLQALTLAGGATSRGSAGRTKVVRIVNGKKVEKKAKATDLVQPEDTLIVPERFF